MRSRTVVTRRARATAALIAAATLGGCVFVDPKPAPGPTPPPAASVPGTSGGAPSATTPDPTRGRFINATPWALSVWIDAPAANTAEPAPVVLQPGATTDWTLSRGPHRIVAHARDPAGSARVIGRYDRTIALDPRRVDGWFLRFRESDFR